MSSSGKLSLAVIFGGVSSEHEVSRMSATSILENLSPEKYDVHMVGITKEGKWLLYTGDVKEIVNGAWEQGPVVPAFLSPDPSVHGLVVLRDTGAETIPLDVIFPALHGKNGEDGTDPGTVPAFWNSLCGMQYPFLRSVHGQGCHPHPAFRRGH